MKQVINSVPQIFGNTIQDLFTWDLWTHVTRLIFFTSHKPKTDNIQKLKEGKKNYNTYILPINYHRQTISMTKTKPGRNEC